jgi:hypothetical protein
MGGFEILPVSENLHVIAQDPIPFSKEQEARIEAIWQDELKRRQGLLFNGTLLEFVEIQGPRITGRFVQYKEYVASRKDPAGVGREIRPLSVSGLTWFKDCVGFGTRANHVRNYPGWLELIPSGGIDKSCVGHDGQIDYHAQLLTELAEETGVGREHVVSMRPFGLILDKAERTYDICLELVTDLSDVCRASVCSTLSEYSQFTLLSRQQLGQYVRDYINQLVPTSVAILEMFGYLQHA